MFNKVEHLSHIAHNVAVGRHQHIVSVGTRISLVEVTRADYTDVRPLAHVNVRNF